MASVSTVLEEGTVGGNRTVLSCCLSSAVTAASNTVGACSVLAGQRD